MRAKVGGNEVEVLPADMPIKDVSMPEEEIGMELKVYQPSIIHHQHIYFHCVTRNPPQTLRSWISRRQRPTTPEDCGGGTSEKVSSQSVRDKEE